MRKAFSLLAFSAVLLAPLASLAQRSTPLLINEKPSPVPDTLARAAHFTGGSTDKVTQERMNKGLVTSSLRALSGQAAGVQVSSSDNHMAMLSSVRVRGTTSLTGGNDPLVIIDGVTSDVAMLSSIYPADIESFTILKNATETAQYGSRGASGVIVVTTKKGHAGKFHISYDGNIGFESVYKDINMLNRKQYVDLAAAMGQEYRDDGNDINYQDAITRTGFIQHHHVAFGGGTETSNYRASIGLMDHDMVVRKNDYNNFIAKLDISQKAFDDRLSVELGVYGSSLKAYDIYDEQKLFYSAATMNPTISKEKEGLDGWGKNSSASQISNPMALLEMDDHERNLNFNTHLKMNYQIWPNLSIGIFGSYTYTSNELAQYLPTWVWAQGQAYRGETKTEDWLANMVLNYWWDFNSDHRIEAMGLVEYQRSTLTSFNTTVKGFTSNEFGYNNLKAGSLRPWGGTASSYEHPILMSFMGNLKYLFFHRYTLGLTLRADGSSKVGENNRWGYFPSVSFEWDLLKEPFIHQLPYVSQLKLRLGAGASGNLGGISSYNSLEMYQPIGIVSTYGTPSVTLDHASNPNPDLKWETRSTMNIGVDLGLWNNRLVMTAEYYYSKTRDMLYLYDVSVPPFPYNKLLANLGKMSNQGFELGLGGTPLETRDMQLNVNLNLSRQQNKLISLSGNYNGQYMEANPITSFGSLNGAGFHGGYNDIIYQVVGQPIGVFYLPHCTGVTSNGDGSYSYEIADLNGDGKADPAVDRYVAGQATPKWTLGSNISFRYKDFDISLQMNGAFGHKIYNGTSLTYMNMGSFPSYNVMEAAPDRNINDQTATDYYLESGDYLNFDYLTIGWNIPIQRVSRNINTLRLSMSINNLGTITSYSGLTPMINSYVVSNTLGIDDKRSYPPYRTYSIGASISF